MYMKEHVIQTKKGPVYPEFQDQQLEEPQDENPSSRNCGTTSSEKWKNLSYFYEKEKLK